MVDYSFSLPDGPARWNHLIGGGHPTGIQPMILQKKLLEYVLSEPFRPFHIRMASGQAFDVRHPEMILVGRTSVRIYTATGEDQHEKWRDASLMLMETVEPLDVPVPPVNP